MESSYPDPSAALAPADVVVAPIDVTRTDVVTPPPTILIEPGRKARLLDIHELWTYRDLLFFLTWREISVRYKQTFLGVAWAVIQPLLTIVVFTVFLGKLAKMPSDGVPYPVFSFLGLLPWTYFANAATRSSTSLVSNGNLLSKVYFPRLLIPLSGTLSALVDFVVALALLVGLMLWYGIVPALSGWWLVPLSLLTAIAAIGVGMALAAINVRYRDVAHAVPFLLQLWMYATPIVYPSSLVPERWRLVFAVNPLTGIIEGYRAAMLGRPMPWAALGVSVGIIAVLNYFGFRIFSRMEREFADVI